MTTRPFDAQRDTALWRAVAGAIAELKATGELKVETADDYVIGFICETLASKWVVASSALTKPR